MLEVQHCHDMLIVCTVGNKSRLPLYASHPFSVSYNVIVQVDQKAILNTDRKKMEEGTSYSSGDISLGNIRVITA